MPRYEFKEGTSNKFWEITLEEESFTTRYGRIGSDGQETTKDFDSAADAKREYNKLIAEKQKKGYALVADDDGQPIVAAKSNPELEAAIAADPANPAPYLVYADWLQAQGDPRGELIVVQHALATGEKTSALRARETALLDTNAKAWTGPCAKAEEQEGEAKLKWRFGFVQEARFASGYESAFDVPEAISFLLSSPAGRFLDDVTIGALANEGELEYQPVVDAIVGKKASALRSLFIGDFDTEDCELSWSDLGNAGKLWAAVPRLKNLIIRTGRMNLGKIDLPELRSAAFRTGGLSKASFKAIAAANWPKLERLEVWFGSDNYGGDCEVADLTPVLQAKGIGTVKQLALMNAEFTDDIVAALADSKILKQIESLDLSMGCMTATGVETLKRYRGSFKHLKLLNISDNAIEADALTGLDDICAAITYDDQSPDRVEEDYRYPAVGE